MWGKGPDVFTPYMTQPNGISSGEKYEFRGLKRQYSDGNLCLLFTENHDRQN